MVAKRLVWRRKPSWTCDECRCHCIYVQGRSQYVTRSSSVCSKSYQRIADGNSTSGVGGDTLDKNQPDEQGAVRDVLSQQFERWNMQIVFEDTNMQKMRYPFSIRKSIGFEYQKGNGPCVLFPRLNFRCVVLFPVPLFGNKVTLLLSNAGNNTQCFCAPLYPSATGTQRLIKIWPVQYRSPWKPLAWLIQVFCICEEGCFRCWGVQNGPKNERKFTTMIGTPSFRASEINPRWFVSVMIAIGWYILAMLCRKNRVGQQIKVCKELSSELESPYCSVLYIRAFCPYLRPPIGAHSFSTFSNSSWVFKSSCHKNMEPSFPLTPCNHRNLIEVSEEHPSKCIRYQAINIWLETFFLYACFVNFLRTLFTQAFKDFLWFTVTS